MNEESLPFDHRGCFIAGQGKSGTTLLLTLLDGHPRILSFPEETAYFPTVLRKHGAAGRRRQMEYLMNESEARLLFSHSARGGGRDYTRFPVERMKDTFEKTASLPANSERDLLAILMESYAHTCGLQPESFRRWIEKTPANRNFIPEILGRFPSAKIILTLRDPRGVFDARLQRERSKKISKLSIFENIRNWRTAATNALAYEGQANFHLVKFEDLLRDPEATLRRLAGFLEVEFLPCLLEPTKAGQAWAGNSAAKTNFGGISQKPLERWKQTLSPHEIAWIETHCGDLMLRTGYAVSGNHHPPGSWWKPIRGESLKSYLRSRLKSARFQK